jgi:hypothetical protein
MKKYLFLITLLFAINGYGQHCGTWRWSVKTLADAEGVQILNKSPRQTTIKSLANELAPEHLSTGHNFEGRLDGEHEIVSVDAFIVEYKREPDHDYHIVLQDPNSSETIVSEIPDPECDNLDGFPELQQRYRSIRAWIDSKVNVTSRMTEADPAIPVKIEGVPFWDAPHGATGASDQGREIHPITDIVSNSGRATAFTGSPTNIELTEIPNRVEPSGGSSVHLSSATTASEMLNLILLGAILGMAGQIIRFVAGLKKSARNTPGDGTTRSITSGLDNKQLLLGLMISLIIGSMAGVLASINLAGKPIDNSVIVAFLAAGYAGTDLIEGFIIK